MCQLFIASRATWTQPQGLTFHAELGLQPQDSSAPMQSFLRLNCQWQVFKKTTIMPKLNELSTCTGCHHSAVSFTNNKRKTRENKTIVSNVYVKCIEMWIGICSRGLMPIDFKQSLVIRISRAEPQSESSFQTVLQSVSLDLWAYMKQASEFDL